MLSGKNKTKKCWALACLALNINVVWQKKKKNNAGLWHVWLSTLMSSGKKKKKSNVGRLDKRELALKVEEFKLTG
jgi:hypothetical protein